MWVNVVLFLALLLPGWATAQGITPRVLVIFDTSGSMLWDYEGGLDCYGDGSEDYPHRAACELGSRMFHAKAALSQIIEASPDFEFGLMRYGQLEPGDAGFGDDQTSVGAQYRNEARTILSSNYDGASNACGPADLLVEPGPLSRDPVLQWMDGQESYPNNKELRGNGFTPLTDSMLSAQTSLVRMLSEDPEAECRPYYVLLLTDGYQQCPGADASDANVRAEVATQLALTTGGLRNLVVQGQRKDVRTFVVGFGPGTAFATELDTMARAGGTAVNANGDADLFFGNAYQANDPQALAAALGDALDNAQPRELCDGLDNDCDGAIDEDFPNLGQPCREGIGACGREGVVICADDGDGTTCTAEPGDPRDEVCDGSDNDCDGQVDERLLNQCGGCGDLPVEECNQRDDDCDGQIDEGALNRCGECGEEPDEACDGADNDCDGRTDEGALNACGECGVVPAEVCDCADNDCDNSIDEGLECPRCDCDPSPEACDGSDNDCDYAIDEGVLNACGGCGDLPPEVCNGLDEDCDGRIDELVPEQGDPCGDALGQCQEGWLNCVDGELICDGEVQPESEICDRLDNDCDGTADEGAYNACGWCGAPRAEVCDNIDNDCDGVIDGPGLCPTGTNCVNGECAPPCQMGECFDNRICVDGDCVAPCRNADCPSGWVCRDAECHDPCAGIECPSGRYCSLGACVELDCYGGACPSGQICQMGECVPDPCANAECAPGQGCIDGRCFDDCAEIVCPTGQVCINGECGVDDCARANCPYPQVCVEGACVLDPCADVACPVGRACVDGACVDDPCIGVICPNGAVCRNGRCPGLGRQVDPGGANEPDPQPEMLPPPPPPPATDDCACQAADGDGPSGWWLLPLIGAVGLRRRR